MIILGIETSCDETSVAIIEGNEDNVVLKSNIIASSLDMHAQTGGIIPENAAREQIKYILPVLKEALQKADIQLEDIDAIGLTYGPGLIGSLLVGVETARTIAYVLNKPIVPINHMVGHIYANWLIATAGIEFPAIALVISGGHTDLLLMKKHGDLTLLGGTRDDAAGEAFDKIGRLLGLPYPAGPVIEELAKKGDPKRFRFPRPMVGSHDLDFSFSGLKAAVLREVISLKENIDVQPTTYNLQPQTIADLARATQDAIIDVVTKKTLKAAQGHNAKSILISGGVAANQTLAEELRNKSKELSINVFVPTKSLCTDNAAMVAAAAYFNYNPVNWQNIAANPELYFD